jgi:hypothetical protein
MARLAIAEPMLILLGCMDFIGGLDALGDKDEAEYLARPKLRAANSDSDVGPG